MIRHPNRDLLPAGSRSERPSEGLSERHHDSQRRRPYFQGGKESRVVELDPEIIRLTNVGDDYRQSLTLRSALDLEHHRDTRSRPRIGAEAVGRLGRKGDDPAGRKAPANRLDRIS